MTLCDARPAFATTARFPDAHKVVVRPPHEYPATPAVTTSTVVCVLTHDARFDVPSLAAALWTESGFIGAVGSPCAHADRIRRLREVGVTTAELARLAAPIDLDSGAAGPEETAVPMAAEIIAQRRDGSGRRLRDLDRPIHHTDDSVAACGVRRFGAEAAGIRQP